MTLFAQSPENPDFYKWLWTQGPSIIFLALAVYFVGKALIAESSKKDAAKQDLINELKARITVLEGQREIDSKRLDQCEDDRATLRAEMAEMKRRTA